MVLISRLGFHPLKVCEHEVQRITVQLPFVFHAFAFIGGSGARWELIMKAVSIGLKPHLMGHHHV